jgi:hypothetical protein
VFNNVRFFVVIGGHNAGDAVGYLGQDVLQIGDVDYDFAHGAVRFIKPHDCENSGLAYWATNGDYSVIPISIPPSRGLPIAREPLGVAYVNGSAMRMAFDTSDARSYMSLEAAARVGLKPGGPGVVPGGIIYGIAPDGIQTWIGPVASFKIGDEEVRNTKVRFGESRRTQIDMLLGADFFMTHRVLVSKSQHKVYFSYLGGPVFDVGLVGASAAADPAPKPAN